MITVNGELSKLAQVSTGTGRYFNRTQRTVTLRPEVTKWLENYFGDDTDKLMFVFENWRVRKTSTSYSPYCLDLVFQEEQDAIAFKLAWC